MPPIYKTRPCAVCGEPIELRYPRGNQRVHAGACATTRALLHWRVRKDAPLYRLQRQRKAAP